MKVIMLDSVGGGFDSIPHSVLVVFKDKGRGIMKGLLRYRHDLHQLKGRQDSAVKRVPDARGSLQV